MMIKLIVLSTVHKTTHRPISLPPSNWCENISRAAVRADKLGYNIECLEYLTKMWCPVEIKMQC